MTKIVMEPQFSGGFKRKVVLSAANVETGAYTEFTQKNIAFTDIAKAAFSSSSIPFVFPPYKWTDKGVFMDGGTVYNINLEGAVRQCMDLVDSESKIIVDVFICDAKKSPDVITETGEGWENFYRSHELSKFYGSTNSLA